MDNLKVKLIRNVLKHTIYKHQESMKSLDIGPDTYTWHEGMIAGLQLALDHLEEEEL